MKFDENDLRFSEFGFLLEELSFTEKYIDTVFKAGLNLILIENINLFEEDQTYCNYVYSMNSVLKQNLIKSTFLFLFSNYEYDLFRFIRKYKHSKDGELHTISRAKLKDNMVLIQKLLEPQQLDYAHQLFVLEGIRNIIIHRNGKLVKDDQILKEKKIMFNNENIYTIDYDNQNISLNENIIFYTHEIVGKFHEDLINKALNTHNIEFRIKKCQK